MGGWNSGRSGGRPLADTASSIDLAWLFRTNRAKEGFRISGGLSWTWSDGSPAGSIGYAAIMDEPGYERLELRYTRGTGDKREDIHQTICLTYTEPHYGGKRWWMICPYQHVRVSKLYLPGGGDRFASRRAWRLGYRCQRVSKADQASNALFKLQRKLGCEAGAGNWLRRPKGMWQRTYERHLARFEELNHRVNLEFLAMAARLGIFRP